MPSMLLKFQKFDKFNNPVFIANQSSLPESYEKLTKYHAALEKKAFDTFLPIYSHEMYSYATVRFFKNTKYKVFTEGSTYKVDFSITTKDKNERTFVNCYIKKVKFHSKPAEIDQGEILDLD